jgi:hypothetical protein
VAPRSTLVFLSVQETIPSVQSNKLRQDLGIRETFDECLEANNDPLTSNRSNAGTSHNSLRSSARAPSTLLPARVARLLILP